MTTYEIPVCPLCGERVEVDEMFGDGTCSTHGLVVPLEFKLEATFDPRPAWLVQNGIVARWVTVDPRTQNYGTAGPPKVLQEFRPKPNEAKS